MTLGLIVLATLVAGVGSVWIAAALIRLGIGREGTRVQEHHLLSFAAGALLATAFIHLLPEALEAHAHDTRTLFAILLAGLLAFFLLDKAEIWHHGHEHAHHPHHSHEDAHAHDDHTRRHPPSGGWAILAGDSIHCFGDGVLIASAFLVDARLGILSALSVLAHEIPHHISDLIVLARAQPHAAGPQRRRKLALVKVSIAGAVTLLGGIAGYAVLAWLGARWQSYFLILAASSFIYVALADLIPQLQLKLSAPGIAAQVAWLLGGMLLVGAVSSALHHGHDHGHAHSHSHQPAHQELNSFRQHPLHIDRLIPRKQP
ncbi:MAG: ZIP family metal transporter [Comamonadaceae bacterium]|nr:ZIP family metal transporter [Comamonadaceae bacterium]